MWITKVKRINIYTSDSVGEIQAYPWALTFLGTNSEVQMKINYGDDNVMMKQQNGWHWYLQNNR
jgi:hypothetical protein